MSDSERATILGRLEGLADRFRPRRTAFVLSGGGNLGAVHVGMLRALHEAGIEPDLIIGCSVGAINGAGFAAEPNQDGVARLSRIWGRLSDGEPDLMPSRLVHVAAQMARKGQALHDPDVLAQLLDEELAVATFEELAVPFSCVATDIATADEHWFDRGRLVPALLASAALPAVYPAMQIGAREFIDGGVLREIHAHRAVLAGATDLYILHVGHLNDRSADVTRPFDAATRAYWLARQYRMADDLKRIPERCTVHHLTAGCTPRLRFDDFSRGRELEQYAYEASYQLLQTGVAPPPVPGPFSKETTTDGDVDDNGEADSLAVRLAESRRIFRRA